jgi:copper/silver efflux system protein
MTVATMFVGLVPIRWATGTGSDVMKRIAAPMIGGILTSFVSGLVVYPAVYEVWKWDFGIKRRITNWHPNVWRAHAQTSDAELEVMG